MPYIDQEARRQMMHGRPALTAGELNYQITKQMLVMSYGGNIKKCCLAYLNTKGTSYQTMNDIIGALDCAVMEYKRRLGRNAIHNVIQHVIYLKEDFYAEYVAPYEDIKIEGNGDVY